MRNGQDGVAPELILNHSAHHPLSGLIDTAKENH
jgi:hypothetical protein